MYVVEVLLVVDKLIRDCTNTPDYMYKGKRKERLGLCGVENFGPRSSKSKVIKIK